jgi:hypothetical protein
MVDDWNGVRITVDDVDIYLVGVNAADLNAGDFIF